MNIFKHPLFFRYLICKSEFKTLGTIEIVGPHPNYARKILKVAAWNLFKSTLVGILIGPGLFIPWRWTLFTVLATALWVPVRRTTIMFTFCNKKVWLPVAESANPKTWASCITIKTIKSKMTLLFKANWMVWSWPIADVHDLFNFSQRAHMKMTAYTLPPLQVLIALQYFPKTFLYCQENTCQLIH